MKVFIGADHQGFQLKAKLVDYLRSSGHEVIDEGDTVLKQDDDFPQFAGRVAQALLADSSQDARGILICGSGQGMCMAANRFKGIRASLAWDVDEAHTVRNDDDSNILCLPASILKSERAMVIIQTWLSTPFAGALRYKRRIKEMDELQ
ncbi:MAG TPA: RpiB/LacA/LacB family sugar-phosphate isomerase [Candidatus Saccharimonadales bacterium]|nr:RpiB/LacA/LacB family sugar-phosphate isomerase [Candidatus Saccharimonadales bacterium]